MEHRATPDSLRTLPDPDAVRDAASQLHGDAVGHLAGRFERWLSEATVEEAARNRARRAWLRRVRDEDRSVVGLLLGSARRGERIGLGTIAGDMVRGVVLAVGTDVVVLDTGGATALVALDAVTELLAGTTMDDGEAVSRTLADALRLLEPGTELRVTTRAGGAVRVGRLVSVGLDVLTLEADARLLLHVPIAALVCVRVDEPATI
jgi:hypothetical protein